MPGVRRPHSRIQRAGTRLALDLRRRLALDIRRAREDAGITQRTLARAAGISSSTLHALERGRYDPTTEVLARVGAALGMDLSMRLYPGTGPLIRDHSQAAMIEALLGIVHARWRPSLETWVTRPVKGVIDLVLDSGDEGPLVATEAQSDLRRLEQQVRWAHAKSEALARARGRATSSLLLLRNTRRNRVVVAEHAASLRAAYPARAAEAFAALTDTEPWHGPAILWVEIVPREGARIRAVPPRGITVGR